jgi:hypothetical protein
VENPNDNVRRAAIESYIEQLRNGDPHALTTAHMLHTTLAQLELTFEDFGTTDTEVEECIQHGRKISAAMLLAMSECKKLDDATVVHFFASTLRYGTKNYHEVVQYLRDIAAQCSVRLVRFEAVQHRFEEIIQDCYATVAKHHLYAAIRNHELPRLTFLEEIVTEGELDLERHLGTTREEIERLKARIRNFHEDLARKALLCLRGYCEHTHIPESMNRERYTIFAAIQSGRLIPEDIGITAFDMEQIISAHDREAALRSKAAFN